MRRVAAQLLRLAVEFPEFGRVLVAELKGRPEFRQEIEGKRFRNPDTGNKVLFDSLPEKEQRRIYLEWWRGRRKEQGDGKGPKAVAERRERIERSNPWAVPLWEYYDRVQEGAGKKWHAPGEIKTQTVESLSWIGAPKDDDVKIGEREFGGKTYSFYRGTDRNKYVKRDENDDIVRDPETGNATYLNDEEMLEAGLPLFETTIHVYDGDTPVGSVANEWGATLVQVAEEHQKRGIGKFLSKLWRKAFPFKGSGGFSDQGLSTFKRVYQDFVREALEAGEYDKAMAEGWMTPQRLKEILDSAGLDLEGNERGKPQVQAPREDGSDDDDEMTPEQQEVADRIGELMREHRKARSRGDHEKADELHKEWMAASDEFGELVRKEKEQREKEQTDRDQRMSELASAYWKAKQRGDTEEAKRVWDQMGAA